MITEHEALVGVDAGIFEFEVGIFILEVRIFVLDPSTFAEEVTVGLGVEIFTLATGIELDPGVVTPELTGSPEELVSMGVRGLLSSG